jgi:hypothetical protein
MLKRLAVYLGLRDKNEKDFTNMLNDMTSKFKNKQGIFMGFRNTFVPEEGHPDMPENRKFQAVSSTVAEQLDYFKEHTRDYFNTVFAIERTNAGGVTAELIVNEKSWGTYTTLELLRLKGILDSKLKLMVQDLPIRPETVIWEKTNDPVYAGRNIYESPLDRGKTKTTLKRIVIINDPHIADSPHPRQPMTQQIDTPVNTGEYTKQDFSGAITNKERAGLEVAYNQIYKGVVAALEAANSAEIKESDLGDKVLDYLFK